MALSSSVTTQLDPQDDAVPVTKRPTIPEGVFTSFSPQALRGRWPHLPEEVFTSLLSSIAEPTWRIMYSAYKFLSATTFRH